MKVTAFNGSPRGAKGNTDVIVQALFRGMKKAGAEVESVYLKDHTIHHCSGCFACWFKTPGKCIHADDMNGLLTKYTQSDIVCFATPVYTWNMTAHLKNFVDRLAPLKSPLLTEANGRYDLKDRANKMASFMVIANAGFPGAKNFDTMRAVFSSCNPVLELYRNCGMVLQKEDPRVLTYLLAVEEAGYQYVANGKVSAEVVHLLESDMIPEEEYQTMLRMG